MLEKLLKLQESEELMPATFTQFGFAEVI